MKTVDIRSKSDDELSKMIVDLRKEQFNLRFQKESGQLEGTARIRVLRRDVAKIKTVLNERLAEKPAKKAKA